MIVEEALRFIKAGGNLLQADISGEDAYELFKNMQQQGLITWNRLTNVGWLLTKAGHSRAKGEAA